MRGWTLVVSIVVHLCVIAGVVVAPLFATDKLPEPPRAAPEYVLVTAHIPDAPAPRRPVTPVETTIAAPLTSPDDVAPETVPPQPQRPETLDVGIGGGGGGIAELLPGGVAGTVDGGDLIPPTAPAAPKQPIRVSALQAPRKIRDVAPRYPALAQASRVEGIVILEALIAEDGSVQDVRVLRSKPLLDEAAVEAVRQWRFTPTLLGGQPVPVVMTVTVSFNLNK